MNPKSFHPTSPFLLDQMQVRHSSDMIINLNTVEIVIRVLQPLFENQRKIIMTIPNIARNFQNVIPIRSTNLPDT